MCVYVLFNKLKLAILHQLCCFLSIAKLLHVCIKISDDNNYLCSVVLLQHSQFS